ncbi:MAG TPA: NAD(P)-dependent oxidoreductase [Acidimicrobiales bacterium]
MSGGGHGAGTVAVHCGRWGTSLLDALRRGLPEADLVASGTPEAATADVLVTLADDGSAVAGALTPSVRWVHILGAGADGFPFDVLGDRVLTCSRGAGAAAIAEFVLATMLAFEKDLPGSWVTEPPDAWNTAHLGGLEGRSLGLVGLGAIGTQVARRALAFDMEVAALRRSTAPSPMLGVAVVPDLAALLGRSDHVVIAAPATVATFHLLDDAALAHARPRTHLVNVARGSLVDQGALLRALDDGRVARASLDVVEPEPLPAGHPFYSHPDVYLSPHISWSSPRTGRRTVSLFADNLDRYRNGADLHGIVDTGAGY